MSHCVYTCEDLAACTGSCVWGLCLYLYHADFMCYHFSFILTVFNLTYVVWSSIILCVKIAVCSGPSFQNGIYIFAYLALSLRVVIYLHVCLQVCMCVCMCVGVDVGVGGAWM